MVETVTFSRDDLAGLAAKLDALGEQLSDKERMLLVALFDLAGDALADAAEVEGNLLLPAVQKVRDAATRAQPTAGLGTVSLERSQWSRFP